MSRHQRLQHLLASPARSRRQQRNRRHRIAQREMLAEWERLMEPYRRHRMLVMDEMVGMMVHRPVSLALGSLDR